MDQIEDPNGTGARNRACKSAGFWRNRSNDPPMAQAVRRGIETEIAPAPCRETRQRSRPSPRLWKINCRPAGRDLEFWLQAERELREAEE